MSHLSPNLRPMLLSNHSSSSLDGMEIVSRRSSLRSENSKNAASNHKAKPLPPTPTLRFPPRRSSRASSALSSRRPSFASSRSRTHSTASSIYTEDVPPAPKYLAFRKDTLLPSAWFDSDSESIKERSSTLNVPETLLSGPKIHSSLQGLSTMPKDPPESLFTEWKPPKYQGSDDEDDDEDGNGAIDETHSMVSADHNREAYQIAEQHANDYMSVLARASMMPTGDFEPYPEGYISLPTDVSPRITDVVDETLVPRPLRKSTALDSSTSSHFSDSSGYMALKEEYAESFKSRAKKAFHSHKFSQDKKAKKRPASQPTPIESNTGEIGQILSMTPSERASIQRDIIEMYDTLTGLYDPLKQHDPTPELKPRIEILEDFQSPVMPIITDQNDVLKEDFANSPPQSPLTMSAQESWFPTSPVAGTPKISHFSLSSQESSCKESHASFPLVETKKRIKTYSLPQAESKPKGDRSVSGKFKKAVGLESKKPKQTDGKKWREDMKKKIKVVETIEHGPFLI